MNTSDLQSVHHIVTHANCSDGRASAVILHAAFPDAQIVEMYHNSTEHVSLRPAPGYLFCDFVPWVPSDGGGRAEIIEAWNRAGTVVLDHHRGAEDIVRAFGARGVFADEKRDPGVSGATLAAHAVMRLIEANIPDPDVRGDITSAVWAFSRLVGVRDTWQRKSPDWQRACELSEVLRFLSLDACLRRGPVGIMATAADIGADLWAKKADAAKEAARTAVRTEIGGHRVAIIPSLTLTSDVAEVIGDAADIVAGFEYVQNETGDRVKLQWSLRSKVGVDVSAVARRHGGNGHTAAAGFGQIVIDDEGNMPASENPYDCASYLFC